MTIYLVTYRPLIGKPAGREAIKNKSLSSIFGSAAFPVLSKREKA